MNHTPLLALCALLALGCGEKEPEDTSSPDDSAADDSAADDSAADDTAPATDLDGDGVSAEDGDCDDNDPSRYPGNAETCNEVDDNCDGVIDEGVTTTFYADADADGFGVDGQTVEACAAPEGYSASPGDCDDADAAYNPGASESDCTDPNDYNCDGLVGAVDNDGDGYFACEECNDRDADVNPGATESCNEVDDDCDSQTDEGVTTTFYTDADADGYGDGSNPVEACEEARGRVSNDDDCDDGDSAINPDAADDYPDNVDDDCDGQADDDVPSYSHAADIQPLWDSYCGGCHTGGGASGGLALDNGYTSMVNVASSVRGYDQVEPGSTSNSYLWHKINGTQSSVGGSGSRMPRGSSAMSASDLLMVEIWILTGAAR